MKSLHIGQSLIRCGRGRKETSRGQVILSLRILIFFPNRNVDNHRVKLQLWDTAGQERFRAMAPMYYRKANAAFLVYDITSYSTFEHIKDWIDGM